MPRLSIIIVAHGPPSALEETLVSVLESRPDDCEILVAHAGTYDDPYSLEGEVRFVEVPANSSRLQAWQIASEASEGEILHFLGCGAVVEPTWCDEALLFFADRRVGSVTPLVLAQRDRTRVLSAGVEYARGGARRVCGQNFVWREAHADRLHPVGPDLSAAFYRRAAWIRGGGLSDQVGEQLADIDLALRLRAAGYTTVFATESRVYAESLPAAVEGAFAAGRHAESLFWHHAPGGSWALSMVAHFGQAIVATIAHGWKAPAHLLGRMLTLTNIPALRRPSVAPAAAEVASPRSLRIADSMRMRRIDTAHNEHQKPATDNSAAPSPQQRRRAS